MTLQRVVLGRTGLEVSVAGLGCGGHSRLGRGTGATEAESVRIVQRALELGITYVDTAEQYGTEEIVGRGIAGRRDEVVLSTKVLPRSRDGSTTLDAAGLRAAVERSLARLRTETIDVYHLHAVEPDLYDYCLAELVPELERLRGDGLIRFLAISELFQADPAHAMLNRAVADGCWDVVMVGFNPLNPSARHGVLPAAIAGDIGVEVMFAVRTAFSRPESLRRVVATLVEEGHVAAGAVDLDYPLGFLVRDGAAASVVDAAYRFARHEPGCHVVLTGTGNVEHLEQNVRSIGCGPLPEAAEERLERLFGGLAHLSDD